MSTFDLTIANVKSVIADQQLRDMVEKIKGYNELIANDAISTLQNHSNALAAWEYLHSGLIRCPELILLGNGKTLEDYPDVISDVIADGFTAFNEWLQAERDELGIATIREQAILRNVNHFFGYVVRMRTRLPDDFLEVMEAEFKDIDYFSPTLWLSKVVNGLQTSLGEVYVVECYFKKRLPDS
jgi:hypothetical protein